MPKQDDGVGEEDSEEEGTAGDGSASLGSEDSDADVAANEDDDEADEAAQRRLNIRTSAGAAPACMCWQPLRMCWKQELTCMHAVVS